MRPTPGDTARKTPQTRRTGGNRAHATTPVPSPELPHRDPGGEAKNLGHRPGGLHNVLDHGPGSPSRGYLGAGQALQRVRELPGGRPHRDGNTAGVRGPPVPPEGPERRPLPRHAVVGDPMATAASAAVFLILGPGRRRLTARDFPEAARRRAGEDRPAYGPRPLRPRRGAA